MASREERQWQHHKAAKTMRKVQREVRKRIKRNRKPKRARSKDWMPDSFDDLDALDELSIPGGERVMPRGERERRSSIWSTVLMDSEDEEEVYEERRPSRRAKKTAGQRGVVVEVSSSLCWVDLGGRSLLCSLRGSLSAEDTGFTNVVAVGDRVLVSDDGDSGQGIVEAVSPRRSALTRPEVHYGHLQQVIVANADQVLIVASWREPVIWLELIDRYLISAQRHRLKPIVCLNKIDLAEDKTVCRATLQPYLDLGYRVIFTSALTREGVDDLCKLLRDRTTVLAGLSGVGKSSLLAAVQPGLQLRTAEVSQHSGEGRHTTAQVRMLKLDVGGFVVDTPGIREFGLDGLRRGELARFYPEIEALASRCRFDDCSHTHEPGCAVKLALRRGGVSEVRYSNYEKIYRDLPA